MKQLISVIIPAHNEGAYIERTLKSLAVQTYPYVELLVVCNGCSDDTARIARKYCHRLIELEQRGLSRARNAGARKARGDLLIFLDADTSIAPDGLEIIARNFTQYHAAGTLRGQPDSGKLSHRFIYWMKNSVHRSKIHTGSSGIIICWKDAFKRVDGFDESLEMRENSDIIKRMMQYGDYKFINQTSAITSMRRYQQRGTFAVAFHWFKVWLLSLFFDLREKAYEVVR